MLQNPPTLTIAGAQNQNDSCQRANESYDLGAMEDKPNRKGVLSNNSNKLVNYQPTKHYQVSDFHRVDPAKEQIFVLTPGSQKKSRFGGTFLKVYDI